MQVPAKEMPGVQIQLCSVMYFSLLVLGRDQEMKRQVTSDGKNQNKQNLYLEVWSWSKCHDAVIP